MTATAPVSVRLSVGLNGRVAAVAAALDRPKSRVIEQAVEDFVATQEWHLATIEEGIRAADAGQVVVQSWGQPDELPMPTCG